MILQRLAMMMMVMIVMVMRMMLNRSDNIFHGQKVDGFDDED